MPNVTINIPDQHVQRVVHALCVRGGHAEESAANAKLTLLNEIKRIVHDVEYNESLQQVQAGRESTDGIVA